MMRSHIGMPSKHYLIETNLHPGLMAKVYACTKIPNNYGDFKALVIHLD